MNEHQLPTSCIKHWGLGGYLKQSAPHQLLQRQTGTTPAIPQRFIHVTVMGKGK